MFDENGALLPLQEMPFAARNSVNEIEMVIDDEDGRAYRVLKVKHGKDKRGYLDMMAKIYNQYGEHQKAGGGVINILMYTEMDAKL